MKVDVVVFISKMLGFFFLLYASSLYLVCVKYIFFRFYRSVAFEGNNKYAKKVINKSSRTALRLMLTERVKF